jgi:hypothetical protein
MVRRVNDRAAVNREASCHLDGSGAMGKDRHPLPQWNQVLAFFVGLGMFIGLVLPTTFARASGSGSPVQVEQSNSEALRFSVSDLDLQWNQRSLRDGAVQLQDPSLSGFPTVGEHGGPRVPRTGGWLLIPPGTSPELVTLDEKWRSEPGMRLMVESVPVVLPAEEPGLGSVSEILVLPGEAIPANALVPDDVRRDMAKASRVRTGSAVELGEPLWWRGRRICSWTLVPLQHDAQGRATRSLEEGTWEIRFRPDAALGKNLPSTAAAKTTTRGDTRFGGIFLNKELLGDLPTEATARGVFPERAPALKWQGGKSGTLLGNMEGRLAVVSTGLFKVTASLLSQLGFIPSSGVAESEIRLYQRRYLKRLDDGSGQAPYAEIEVPIQMVGDGGDFSGDDYFLFYGLRLRDDRSFTADLGQGPETIFGSGDRFEMNNSVNIYWVAASEPDQGEAWARMATESLAPALSTPRFSYRRTDHHEFQRAFRENPDSASVDRVYANHPDDSEVNLGMDPLWSPDPAGDDVQIDASIAGDKAADQDLELYFYDDENNPTLLEAFTNDQDRDAVIRTNFLPASTFAGASGKFVMQHQTSTKLRTFLNWVQVSYDALYQAVDGELPFHTGVGGSDASIEVTGFTSDDLGLVNIDDPRNPVWINLGAGNVVEDAGGYKLSIQVPAAGSSPRQFYVAQDMGDPGFPQFAYYESTRAEDQINPTEYDGSGPPELVVITHEEFLEASQRYIDHRIARSGGVLQVHLVDVQSIYDWYSGGLRDPWAIKRFAEHAITEWGSYALTIIGDANENARELGVDASARDWSTDWVPTHYHLQSIAPNPPELMASDKWFVTFEAGQDYPEDDFPKYTYSPWEMYVGRLPCNSVAELNLMIDRIIRVETLGADEEWRKRAIFFADDAWSEDPDNFAYLKYKSDELRFSSSFSDSTVPMWHEATGVSLSTTNLYLDDFLDPYWEGEERRRKTNFRNYCESDALPPLISALNAGGMVATYQGHANIYVLASENWFEDRLGNYRKDVSLLTNADKPWVFIGLGCHISDWAQNTVFNSLFPRERSLSEKLAVHPGGGAVASYGSPGYEYINNNARYAEILFWRWCYHPSTTILGDESRNMRSSWVLGDIIWSAEAYVLSILGSSSTYRPMMAQYGLLGCPLMVLDAGMPQVEASFTDGSGGDITETEIDLVAIDATNLRTIRLVARDEAGIHRLEVVDSENNDLTQQVSVETLPAGATTHQVVNYDLTLPVQPYDHAITVRVYDTGGPLPGDRHYELRLNINQQGTFLADGSLVVPEDFQFTLGEPVAFSATFSGATWFDDSLDMTLTSENLELTDIVFNVDKSTEMTVEFTATAPMGTTGERSVDLKIGDFPATTYVLQSGGSVEPAPAISTVLNFPNPVIDGTRFVFRTSDVPSAKGVVRVFSVGGRHVARIPFQYDGNGDAVVHWDGRDDDGDELGNGTYLYRVELTAPGRSVISDMQRLVVMR